MKKKILFLVFVVITSVFIFSFYSPSKTSNKALPQPNNNDKFLVGCIQSYDYLSQHDALGLNVTHIYDGSESGQISNHPTWLTPKNAITGEHLFDNNVPSGTIQTALNNLYNSHNQTKILWMRPKIEWLAYGKSSVYKAAPVPENDDYWFYSFNNNEEATHGTITANGAMNSL